MHPGATTDTTRERGTTRPVRGLSPGQRALLGLFVLVQCAGTPPWLPSASAATGVPAPSAGLRSIQIQPRALRIEAGQSWHRLIVTGLDARGRQRDLSDKAVLKSTDPRVVDVRPGNILTGVRTGSTTVMVEVGDLSDPLEITVVPRLPRPPVSFVRDVLPVLGEAGCNAGSCHAKPKGQNGFELSVFAHDPEADYREITRDDRGRRVFPAHPEASLLLLKPTRTIPHEGGKRFDVDSPAYNLLRDWIKEGMPYRVPGEPDLTEVTVHPNRLRMAAGSTHRVIVIAHYSDGSMRDVTDASALKSNDPEMIQVEDPGVVKALTQRVATSVIVRYVDKIAFVHVTIPSDQSIPHAFFASLPRRNFIDGLAYADFENLGLKPSDLCSESEWIRRAFLDAIGRLPRPEETRRFLEDPDPEKGEKLVDRLLEEPDYADYWANKWADLFRPNPDRVGVKSVYLFDQWLRSAFRRNEPYDRFAREILLHEGSTHGEGPAVIYRDRRKPEELSTIFSRIFLGIRVECARCHHHPFERWSQDDFYQFAAFFGSVKQKGAGLSPPISAGTESFFFRPGGQVRHPRTHQPMTPKPLGSPIVFQAARTDPRRLLAGWMTSNSNPYFAQAVVNRVWASFFGRGFVNPVDDFRASNPPVNHALLNALASDLIEHGYDLKHLMKTIMTSRLYRLSSIPNRTNVADTRHFSRYYRRRLSAEVLLDAVSDITGVPERFAGMPLGARAMQAWTYKIPSRFMDAFSRPNPSTDPPCSRDQKPSVVQALHMMNAEGLQAKLSESEGWVSRLARGPRSPKDIVRELYLAAYCRYPTEDELSVAASVFPNSKQDRQTAVEDVLWALLNSAEFVFNH